MLPKFSCSSRVNRWRLSVVGLLSELACELAALASHPCLTCHTWTDFGVSILAQSLHGFCRLKTAGMWALPCDARVSAHVHCASFGDTRARSIVLSVSPCRVPGCEGLAVDTGMVRTSLSAVSSAHPCWLVPCWSHRLDRALKSPHIMIVSPSLSSTSSRKSQLAPVMQMGGWMYALIRIRNLCLSSGFSIRMSCKSRELVVHLSKLCKDTVLLRLLLTTIAIPRHTILKQLLPMDKAKGSDRLITRRNLFGVLGSWTSSFLSVVFGNIEIRRVRLHSCKIRSKTQQILTRNLPHLSYLVLAQLPRYHRFKQWLAGKLWGRHHGGRRPSSDDSLHSPTVIPPSALRKPSIMKRYRRLRTTRRGLTARSPTMVT